MPKIKRKLKAGSEPDLAGPLSTALPSAMSPDTGPRPKLTPAEEIDFVLFGDFFDERVDVVRWWIWQEDQKGETAAEFDLDELLPRSLWLRLISHSLLGYFDGDDQECLQLLDGANRVLFDWEDTYEDEQGRCITVYTEHGPVGYEEFDGFFEGWEGVALRWLISEIGISAKTLRSALERLMPQG